jgi:hypothetical protein
MPTQEEWNAVFGGGVQIAPTASPSASPVALPSVDFHTPRPWELEEEEKKKREQRRAEFAAMMGAKGQPVSRGPNDEVVAEPGDPGLSMTEAAAPYLLPWAKGLLPGAAGAGAAVATGAVSANPLLAAGSGFAGGAYMGKGVNEIAKASARLQGIDMDVEAELGQASADLKEAHPNSAWALEAAPQFATGRPSFAVNAGKRLVGGGIGAGMAAAGDLMQGEIPSLENVLTGLATGAAFDKMWFEGGAAPPAAKPAPGRPGAPPGAPPAAPPPFADASTQPIELPPPPPGYPGGPPLAGQGGNRIPPRPGGPSVHIEPGTLLGGPEAPAAAAPPEVAPSPIKPPPLDPTSLEAQYRPAQAKAIGETQAQIDDIRAQVAGVKMPPAQKRMLEGVLEGLRKRLAQEQSPEWQSPEERRAARQAELLTRTQPMPLQDAPGAAPKSGPVTQPMPAAEAPQGPTTQPMPAQRPPTGRQGERMLPSEGSPGTGNYANDWLGRPTKGSATAAPDPIPPPPEPTPDRRRWLGRGKHDSVEAIFPDALHARLFDWAGRMRRAVQGKDTFPAKGELDALSELTGLDKQTVQAQAMDYHDHVRLQGKALPAHFDEPGVRVEAPRIFDQRVPAAELPLMPRAAAEEAGLGAVHEAAVNEAFANGDEIHPDNLSDYPDLEQTMDAIGPEPTFSLDTQPMPIEPTTQPMPASPTTQPIPVSPTTQPMPAAAAPPPPSAPPPPPRSPVNLGAINSVHDAMNSVRETAALWGEKTARKPRAVTLEEAAPLIQELTGLTAEQLDKKRPAGGMTRHQLAAWAWHLREANFELHRAAKAVAIEPTGENLARYWEIEQRHAMLQSVVEPGATEFGRGLNMLRDVSLGTSRAQRIAAILKAAGCD